MIRRRYGYAVLQRTKTAGAVEVSSFQSVSGLAAARVVLILDVEERMKTLPRSYFSLAQRLYPCG